MTQIRIKDNETVHISGYVNAVDRFSRPMPDFDGKMFVEKIKPTAFARAIEEADDVTVKLNHKRDITTISESGAKLEEDAVGLYFDGDISDKEIVEKARANELVGWSFGFYPTGIEDRESDNEFIDYERTITAMELVEVTIVDINALPAYPATSIFSRANEKDKLIHVRLTEDKFEIDDAITLNLNKLQLRKREIELIKNKEL